MTMKESKKKTLGRRKIDIKKIENKTSLKVTFSKRRSSLFKKAGELSVLSGSHIAILLQSPSNKVFTFGSPNSDSVLHSFQAAGNGLPLDDDFMSSDSSSRIEYEEALRQLEAEKKGMSTNWWDYTFDQSVDLSELQGFADALENLTNTVLNRADEIAKSTSNLLVHHDQKSNVVDNGSNMMGLNRPANNEIGQLPYSNVLIQDGVNVGSNCDLGSGIVESLRFEEDELQYLRKLLNVDGDYAANSDDAHIFPKCSELEQKMKELRR